MSRLIMVTRAGLSTGSSRVGTLYLVALLREEVGRRIKVARTAAHLSQRELADKIGLANAQDVSRYERGVQQVPDFRIDLIAEATGRQRSYFTRDPAEAEPQTADPEAIARLEADVEVLQRMLADGLERLEGRLAEIAATRPRDTRRVG